MGGWLILSDPYNSRRLRDSNRDNEKKKRVFPGILETWFLALPLPGILFALG